MGLGLVKYTFPREAAKQLSHFFVAPLELSSNIFWGAFFGIFRPSKKIFFLSGQALTHPPPLVAGALQKNNFYFFGGFP